MHGLKVMLNPCFHEVFKQFYLNTLRVDIVHYRLHPVLNELLLFPMPAPVRKFWDSTSFDKQGFVLPSFHDSCSLYRSKFYG